MRCFWCSVFSESVHVNRSIWLTLTVYLVLAFGCIRRLRTQPCRHRNIRPERCEVANFKQNSQSADQHKMSSTCKRAVIHSQDRNLLPATEQLECSDRIDKMVMIIPPFILQDCTNCGKDYRARIDGKVVDCALKQIYQSSISGTTSCALNNLIRQSWLTLCWTIIQTIGFKIDLHYERALIER